MLEVLVIRKLNHPYEVLNAPECVALPMTSVVKEFFRNLASIVTFAVPILQALLGG